MNMKLFSRCFAVVLIATAPFLTSCSKDSNNEPTPEKPITDAVINPEEAQKGYMTLVTEKSVGDPIVMTIDAQNADVWIDLNNDGVRAKDKSEDVKSLTNEESYILGAQIVTIYGKVTSFHINKQELTQLDVKNNPVLEVLDCMQNNLTSLDASKNENLKELICNENNLENLTLPLSLTDLHCAYNKLTSLDISKSKELERVNISNNQLKDDHMVSLLESLPSSGNKEKTIFLYSDAKDDKRPEGNTKFVNETFLKEVKRKNWQIKYFDEKLVEQNFAFIQQQWYNSRDDFSNGGKPAQLEEIYDISVIKEGYIIKGEKRFMDKDFVFVFSSEVTLERTTSTSGTISFSYKNVPITIYYKDLKESSVTFIVNKENLYFRAVSGMVINKN